MVANLTYFCHMIGQEVIRVFSLDICLYGDLK